MVTRPFRILLFALLASALVCAFGALWSVREGAGRFATAQRLVLYESGREFFNDFYMPWKCANEGWKGIAYETYESPDGRSLVMNQVDRCYPPLAMVYHRLVPWSNVAAAVFSFGSGALFLLALFVVFRRAAPDAGPGSVALALAACVLSSPFVFSLERANPIFLSAAAAAIFLAWHDASSRRLRLIAAAALAVAAVLKIAPAVLGVLYLRRRDWKGAALSAAIALVLFAVPFVWFEGVDGFRAWFANAAEHGRVMASHSAFGFVPFIRAERILFGMDWRIGMKGWTLVGQSLGLVALIGVFAVPSRASAVLCAVLALLLLPGNMMFYGALYLLPVLLMRAKEMDRVEAFAWFALLGAMQFPVGFSCLNRLLAAAAVIALIPLALRRK